MTALIGLLSTLEGEISLGQMDSQFVVALGDRLRRDGVRIGRNTEMAVRQALNDLNHRIRDALGEYDEPPDDSPGEKGTR